MKKRKTEGGPLRVLWDNPPGTKQGITIERVVRGHVFSRRVEHGGLLSPTEAACALGVTRVWIYRLIWDGKLKVVKKKGQNAIPLSSLKEFDVARNKKRGKVSKGPWLTG